MQYVRTLNYAAAGVALRNFLRKWPNSHYREEVMYNILLTDHDLAVNSVEQKKKARAEEGLRSFDTFADAYPESRSIKDAQRLRQDLIDLLERLNRPHATMTLKHANAAKTTITRDVNMLDKETGNIYESVSMLGKRANQIAVEIKEELSAKLEEFAISGENLEEVYENREQIEVSKHYERMPKPSAIAIQEMLEGKRRGPSARGGGETQRQVITRTSTRSHEHGPRVPPQGAARCNGRHRCFQGPPVGTCTGEGRRPGAGGDDAQPRTTSSPPFHSVPSAAGPCSPNWWNDDRPPRLTAHGTTMCTWRVGRM